MSGPIRPLVRPYLWSCWTPTVLLTIRLQSTAAESSHQQQAFRRGALQLDESSQRETEQESNPRIRKFRRPIFRKLVDKGPGRELPRPAESNNASPEFSPILLRDMCACPSCVDVSTRQKLFSTAEIPERIAVRAMTTELDSVRITWENDIPGFPSEHETVLPKTTLQSLVIGNSPVPHLPLRTAWQAKTFAKEAQDIRYDDYMQDDATLHRAVSQLHKKGLLFVTHVPEASESVEHIAERIGPLKNTFYGKTWDVRSVPEAKNVAYTSQDLGFHMDLLYMEQPPHIQLLHCIRSSASGGASLFTDSLQSVSYLFRSNLKLFETLATQPVTYHYNHTDSGSFYEHSRPVIELPGLPLAEIRHKGVAPEQLTPLLRRPEILSAVSWAPPFQAPFRLQEANLVTVSPYARDLLKRTGAVEALNTNVEQWHAAARKFNQLINHEAGIYERMMKPGECVLFDNRRVLHARRAFEVGDAGNERWLKGAYIDKDPFYSTLTSLRHRFDTKSEVDKPEAAEEKDAWAAFNA